MSGFEHHQDCSDGFGMILGPTLPEDENWELTSPDNREEWWGDDVRELEDDADQDLDDEDDFQVNYQGAIWEDDELPLFESNKISRTRMVDWD